MDKGVKIYFNKEADFIEILFEIREGIFKETENDSVMRKVDLNGNLIGFSIQNISKLGINPLSLYLKPAA